MLSEQQKKRYCRIGKWLTAIAVFLTVLYCTLTSSYVICNVYLPLVSSYLNVRIEARNIRFSFFRKENIRCKDLNISVGQDIYIFSSRLNGHFS